MKKIILILIFFIFLTKTSLAQEFKENLLTNPSVLKQQAIISYNNKNYKDSLSYFQNIKNSSLEYEDFILIANCYDSLGNGEKAVENLQKAIVLKPQNYAAYYNLGLIYFSLGSLDLSTESFKKAIKFNNEFFEGHYNLGIAFYSKNDYKNALRHFKIAKKLNPTAENIDYNLELTYSALRKQKK